MSEWLNSHRSDLPESAGQLGEIKSEDLAVLRKKYGNHRDVLRVIDALMYAWGRCYTYAGEIERLRNRPGAG